MAFPNRNFSLNQKPKPRIFNESRGNPLRPPRGAARLSREHGSREGRGATHGFLSIPSNSGPDQAPTPGRIRRALIKESREASHRCSTSPSNPCPNPAPTPGRSFQNGRRINRAGIFSLGIRVNRAISPFRRSDPEESRHESFNRDSSFRRRNPGESEHGPFNRGDSPCRRTSPDKSDHPLSDTVEASLGRRWVSGGFLSNRSPSSSPPPPLPPRQQKPKAPTEEKQDDDSLALALAMSLKEIKGKSNEPSTDEEDLLDNIQKMNLEVSKNEEENICVICMDKPKTHAYIPCGHRVVCVKCSEELKKTNGMLHCIICRKKAHGIFQIF